MTMALPGAFVERLKQVGKEIQQLFYLICLNTCSLVCLLSLRCVSCRKRKDMQEVDFQENCHCTVQERAHSFNQQWIIKEGEERQSAIVFDNVQRSV